MSLSWGETRKTRLLSGMGAKLSHPVVDDPRVSGFSRKSLYNRFANILSSKPPVKIDRCVLTPVPGVEVVTVDSSTFFQKKCD